VVRPRGPRNEAEQLRARAFFILDAFEEAEPSPNWERFRQVTTQATRLNDLRTINRELRGAMAGLDPSVLAHVRRQLLERFGEDPDYEKDKVAAGNARTRGRIRSEREYRAVQAYADSIAADVDAHEEFDALGGLLDEYTSRPAT